MFEAVLFDMDGTLIDSEEITLQALDVILRRYGHYLDEELRNFTVRHAWDKVLDAIYSKVPNLPEPTEFLNEVIAEKSIIEKTAGYHLLPGAKEAIERLSKDFKIAIVSGSLTEEIERLIEFMQIEKFINFYIGGDLVDRHKPHPEGFLVAAQRLGIKPGHCVVIEDSPFGIQSGLSAGMAVVAVAAGNRYGFDQSDAHFIIDSLNDLTVENLESMWKAWSKNISG